MQQRGLLTLCLPHDITNRKPSPSSAVALMGVAMLCAGGALCSLASAYLTTCPVSCVPMPQSTTSKSLSLVVHAASSPVLGTDQALLKKHQKLSA